MILVARLAVRSVFSDRYDGSLDGGVALFYLWRNQSGFSVGGIGPDWFRAKNWMSERFLLSRRSFDRFWRDRWNDSLDGTAKIVGSWQNQSGFRVRGTSPSCFRAKNLTVEWFVWTWWPLDRFWHDRKGGLLDGRAEIVKLWGYKDDFSVGGSVPVVFGV